MSSPADLEIAPAKLLSSRSHAMPGQLLVTELFFQVPLDYANASAGNISLFARCATKRDPPPVAPGDDDAAQQPTSKKQKPYMVYLEGGPGFGNRPPQEHPLTRAAIARGYQVLFLDHRGTGLSTPVCAELLSRLGDVDAQVAHLRLMRQDNTVRDCEAVRRCLTQGWPPAKTAWSIFGQSYGGFVALSYLSMHPQGLREVFLTGGLAPVGKTPDQVYQATFRKTAQRNHEYFAKYPEDAQTLHQLASYIQSCKDGAVPLPAGGSLTVPRLLTLGIALGGHGGFDSIHGILVHLKASLDQSGFLSRAALQPIESSTPFDTNIIYAILHEAIYCDGPGSCSNWSAYRVGAALERFSWLKDGYSCATWDNSLYMSGEAIFPFYFDTYPELIPLKQVAEKLAAIDDWPKLYHEQRLRNNTVPVFAASYIDDMYVDYDFANDTSQMLGACKAFQTNMLYHSALRAKSEEVLQTLFTLRDDVLD